MRFLHCSDPHITQDYSRTKLSDLDWRRILAMLEQTVGGRAAAYRQARASLRRIASCVEDAQADHLVVTGDLTAYATDDEFGGVREALGTIGESRATCSVVPGNHDLFTPESAERRAFEVHFGHLLESDLPEYACDGPYPFVHLKADDSAIVGLSSARVPLFPGLAYGVIGRSQLSALRDIIHDGRIRYRAVLVLVHHAPVLMNGRVDTPGHGLRDAMELLDLLPGRRFAVLHGHIHERYHHAATARRPHIFSAGSSTLLGREGYWIIDVADGRIQGGRYHTLAPRAS